jgi:hypothetical protein
MFALNCTLPLLPRAQFASLPSRPFGLESFSILFIVYNLLLSHRKIDLTANYRTKVSDILLLSLKKIDLAADNRKKMRFFAISI